MITVQEKIDLAKMKLMKKFPLANFLLVGFDVKEDQGDEDPFNLYGTAVVFPYLRLVMYNKKKMEEWSVNDVMFMLAHEMSHIIDMSCYRQGSKDPIEWNNACDFRINIDLKNDLGIAPAQHTLLDDQLHRQSAEEIYDKMMDGMAEQLKDYDFVDHWLHNNLSIPYPQLGSSSKSELARRRTRNNNILVNHTESIGELLLAIHKERAEIFKKSTSSWINLETYLKLKYLGLYFSDLDGSGDVPGLGSGSGVGMSDEEKQRRNEALRKLVEEGFKIQISSGEGKGALPGFAKQAFNDFVKPKTPLSQRVKNLFGNLGKKNMSSFSQPNRRNSFLPFHALIPGHFSNQSNFYILLDTSGSMGSETETFRSCLGEILDLADNNWSNNAKFVMCDTQVTNVYTAAEVKAKIDANEFFLEGFGGSDFRPAFHYIWNDIKETNQAASVIAFTDGVIDVPESEPPGIRTTTYWVVTPGGRIPTHAYGKVLEI